MTTTITTKLAIPRQRDRREPSRLLTDTGIALDPDDGTQFLWQRFADGSMTVAIWRVGESAWGPPMDLREPEDRSAVVELAATSPKRVTA